MKRMRSDRIPKITLEVPRAKGEKGSLENNGWMDGVRISLISKDLIEDRELYRRFFYMKDTCFVVEKSLNY